MNKDIEREKTVLIAEESAMLAEDAAIRMNLPKNSVDTAKALAVGTVCGALAKDTAVTF